MRHTTATHIEALMTDDNNMATLRLIDFHPIHPALDPAYQLTHAFAANVYKQSIPPIINNTTPPPKTTANEKKYPDNTKKGK